MSSPVFRISDCTFSMFKSSSVKQFHFSDNDISDFEFEFQNEKIEDIDLSNNHIRAINQKSLSGLTSLKRDGLSRNAIHTACSTSATFMSLFRNSLNLTKVDLSFNVLECLPVDTFELTTRLQELYIRITCPYVLYPLTPHFYIVKLGFTGVYIIFLFLL